MDLPTEMPPAEVKTFIGATSTREVAPETRKEVGVVRFGAAQLHAVPSAGHPQDAYLVRVNVELDLAPGTDGPRWAEAGFEFTTAGVSVLDAVPRSVRSAQPQSTYRLNPQLNFVTDPADAAGGWTAPLGPQDPVTEAFGIGYSRFRWRWTATGPHGVSPGPRGGWLVLLVPPGSPQLGLRHVATYWSAELDDEDDLEPGCDPVERSITLPTAAPSRARAAFPGAEQLEVIRRLGGSWTDLAVLVGVPAHESARFPRGDEPRHLWQWLAERDLVADLPTALAMIGREDLAVLLPPAAPR